MDGKTTVLIADGEKNDRKLLRDILADDYDIIEASNGKEAVEFLQAENNFAAVILELTMPVMDGYDVLKSRMQDEEMRSIPFLVVTHNKEEIFEVNALKLGADDFIRKPFKKEILQIRLANLLEKESLQPRSEKLDELTGFLRRNSFYHAMRTELAEHPKDKFDVLAMDVVHFSLINDTYGTEEGDKLLVYLSGVIKKHLQDDIVCGARIYADKFLFLVKRNMEYTEVLKRFSEKHFAKYTLDSKIHIKFGIYEIAGSKADVSAMCDKAIAAIYIAKEHFNMDFAYYNDSMHERHRVEQQIADEMDDALQAEQFVVYFQPKYDIDHDCIIGAEALVRWKHPSKGLIMPDEFIPLFERNGFISELDSYIWEKTAKQLSIWQTEGKLVVPVSVNVSRQDINVLDVEDK